MEGGQGSDSDRLMAEIEAFLATGEGPPAAAEPVLRPSRPATRPLRLEAPDPRSGGSKGQPGGGVRDRISALARPPALRAWHRPRSRSAGRRYWDAPPGSARSRSEPAPRWTPWRAVLVAAGMAAVLLVPVLVSDRTAGPAAGGSDRASAAPHAAGYTFLRTNPTDTPLRWNPCRPIHYVTDLAGAPAWTASDLQTAVGQVSLATGISFEFDGNVTGSPGVTTASSPVVIRWSSQPLPSTDPAASADDLARTVPEALMDTTGRGEYVTGMIVISSTAADLPPGFVAGGEGVLFLHALGRLVGLGDVPQAGEVMNPQVLSTPTAAFGPGDRTGLARLGGNSGCLPAPPASDSLEPVL